METKLCSRTSLQSLDYAKNSYLVAFVWLLSASKFLTADKFLCRLLLFDTVPEQNGNSLFSILYFYSNCVSSRLDRSRIVHLFRSCMHGDVP